METLQEAISRGPRLSERTDGVHETPRPVDHRGAVVEEITNAMVCLHKELFGRGPTKARSIYKGPDTVVVTLENGLTTAERNMLALGEHRPVWETRMVLLRASERTFVETLERITGRTVRACVSEVDVQKDVSDAVFYFEPVASAEAPKDG